MSTNFHIVATCECLAIKTGERFTHSTNLYVWQTPTSITREIMASDNPLQAYKEWVRSISRESEELVFSVAGPFKQASVERINIGEEHIKALDEVLAYYKDWDITYEAW